MIFENLGVANIVQMWLWISKVDIMTVLSRLMTILSRLRKVLPHISYFQIFHHLMHIGYKVLKTVFPSQLRRLPLFTIFCFFFFIIIISLTPFIYQEHFTTPISHVQHLQIKTMNEIKT